MTKRAQFYLGSCALLSVGVLGILFYLRWFHYIPVHIVEPNEGKSAFETRHIELVRMIHAMGDMPYVIAGLWLGIVSLDRLVQGRRASAADRAATVAGILFLCLAVSTPVWLWPSIDCYPRPPTGWESARVVTLFAANVAVATGALVALRRVRQSGHRV